MAERATNVSSLIRHGESFLTNHGVLNARRNAEWILAHVLDCRSVDLYLDTDHVPAARQIEEYDQLLERRGLREPLQYVLGTTEFMSLPFYSTPGVFIPRPETELLVEKVEVHLTAVTPPRRLADLCCGAGAIGISLARRVADTAVTAVDVSAAAVELTKKNADLNDVEDRVQCVCADARAFLLREDSVFDVITCNPPYIRTGDLETLAPEIAEHEPRVALDGGAGGIDLYSAIAPVLRGALAPGGIVAFELGHKQTGSVREILERESLEIIELHKSDLGNDRVVVARNGTGK